MTTAQLLRPSSRDGDLDPLFEPAVVGDLRCRSRIVMAPCTRCHSPGFEPGDAVRRYYARRAADGVGLLITEGTTICRRGNGYPNVPGIWSDSQVQAWRRITDEVHRVGGTIICQLWHVGSFAHPLTTGGYLPEGPSGVSPTGFMKQVRGAQGGPLPYGRTETMTVTRIGEIIDQFAAASQRAKQAGFDGVELHGAHGYLIDQFINLHWNRRVDAWGGDNRCRFAGEIARRVVEVWGAGRVVFRFSPTKSVGGPGWVRPRQTLDLLAATLWQAGVRLLHASVDVFDQVAVADRHGELAPLHRVTRELWPGALIGVGSLSPPRAARAIRDKEIDLAAFGRLLIANPDFLSKVREDRTLEAFRPDMLLSLD